MRKLILRILVTVDGVAAGEKGSIDMVDYGDDDAWDDIFQALENVDAMLIGGTSHREYLDYWHGVLKDPKAKPNEKKFAEIDARTPHYILSRTLKKSDWPNATVLSGGVDGVAELKRQSGGDILLWGGPTVAAAAIEAGLVDEYHLETHPVIAGRGKKLFANVESARRLRHLDTKILPSGIAIQKYSQT